MSRSQALRSFAEWLGRSIPDSRFYYELVQALYATPKSIVGAVLTAALIVGICAWFSDDPAYVAALIAFGLIGVGRLAALLLYNRSSHDPEDVASTQRWEMGALVGACAFAGLVGITGAYTVMVHPGGRLEILVSGCVLGYIAGISSRNASRPIISVGQITLTCLPFMGALVWTGDVVHIVLALFIGVLYVSTISICRSVFDTIVARHDAYSRITIIAQRDALTGLWNRSAFLQLLDDRLHNIAGGGSLALIAIDLDRFKDVNDTFGHPAGDAILQDVAGRLKRAVRPGCELARVGGDEFFVIGSGMRPADVETMAQDILREFSQPFVASATNHSCGASIGYAMAPADGNTLDLLLRNADLALYEAKRDGRGRVVRYRASLARAYEDRIVLENDLRSALTNGELRLVYQPIVDPRSGRAICCEALLRWHHPERGVISPSIFVPIAEATGLINPIGAWVLETACAEATNWSPDIKVSVNLSAVQFRSGRAIVDTVKNALARSGLAPSRLDLEVTESVLIENTAETIAVLDELRTNDIGISLDDFGTGFASLSYLNDFPFSRVKIDRKFSQNVDCSARSNAIITGIAHIARDLRIELVAEGIETEAQLAQMRSYGINAIQGYLFSKPLPEDLLRQVIREPIRPALIQAQGGRTLEQSRRAAS